MAYDTSTKRHTNCQKKLSEFRSKTRAEITTMRRLTKVSRKAINNQCKMLQYPRFVGPSIKADINQCEFCLALENG